MPITVSKIELIQMIVDEIHHIEKLYGYIEKDQ
jgi:hypothetical protein